MNKYPLLTRHVALLTANGTLIVTISYVSEPKKFKRLHFDQVADDFVKKLPEVHDEIVVTYH